MTPIKRYVYSHLEQRGKLSEVYEMAADLGNHRFAPVSEEDAAISVAPTLPCDAPCPTTKRYVR